MEKIVESFLFILIFYHLIMMMKHPNVQLRFKHDLIDNLGFQKGKGFLKDFFQASYLMKKLNYYYYQKFIIKVEGQF